MQMGNTKQDLELQRNTVAAGAIPLGRKGSLMDLGNWSRRRITNTSINMFFPGKVFFIPQAAWVSNRKHGWVNIVVRLNWWFGSSLCPSLRFLTQVSWSQATLLLSLVNMMVPKARPSKPSQATLIFYWNIRSSDSYGFHNSSYFPFNRKCLRIMGTAVNCYWEISSSSDWLNELKNHFLSLWIGLLICKTRRSNSWF